MNKYKKWIIGVISFIILSLAFYNYFLLKFLFPIDKNIKEFISNNYIVIDSIDPMAESFDDLIFLKQSIGKSDIVFLGEQDHGDGPTMLAKTRIVKFLYEEMGFDVIVFESDFYGLNNAWEKDLKRNSKGGEYIENIYPIWTECKECNALFKYIDQKSNTKRPLQIAGADPRHSLKYSKNNYLHELTDFLDERIHKIDSSQRSFFLNTIKNTIENEYNIKIKATDQKKLFGLINKFKEEIESNSFWYQELNNLEGFVRNSLDTLKSNNIRDIQMGNNLLWLIKHKYKGKKIIFWSSNFHIIKEFKQLNKYSQFTNNADTINTGSYIYEKLKDKLFVLGFTSYEGRGGRILSEAYTIPEPTLNHFESLVYNEGSDYGYLDFKKGRKKNSEKAFFMKAMVHKPVLASWFKMFDGIFYIKNMYPCNTINGNNEK
ncbi:erythromycin esterase family protein [Echinicola marina]|uniref:erythromycin esterase family protein n=1 Tax=Echinicola marina TaxID=2859768 RepID=UPI001CF67847|nr:erythromycin esterase family protein [Echinicola marina]UCS92402.1 erythromycin esterase family protein [Echinicola marina]